MQINAESIAHVLVRSRLPCSPPRAAHSHSSSVGSLFSFHRQKARASFQLTWTTGKSRRSRMPEPGPAGWTAERQAEQRSGDGSPTGHVQEICNLTCLQKTFSIGNHQGADWLGKDQNISPKWFKSIHSVPSVFVYIVYIEWLNVLIVLALGMQSNKYTLFYY